MSDLISCKSCSHIRYDWKNFPINIGSPYAWHCDKVKTKEEVELDPVNGTEKFKKSERQSCIMARSKYGECGPEGKCWVPKHKNDIFKYIARAGNFASKDQ